jgi:molecular chaperone GrpE
MTDKKNKDREAEFEQSIGELTADLQRVQADFVNYRTRMEEDKLRTIQGAKAATVLKLLPIVDNIERAISHVPPELADNQWVHGVASLAKNLDKSFAELGIMHILAVGQTFDPNLHEAISAEGEGSHEVVSEELRAGYMLDGQVIRHSLVKVTNQAAQEPESSDVAQQIVQDSKDVDNSDDEVKGED